MHTCNGTAMSLVDAIHNLAEIAVTHEHAVRDLLLREGLKGEPGESSGCPVAQWFVRVTGATTARVDTYMIELVYEREDAPALLLSEFTPAVIAEHLDSFDSGSYPELEVAA